MICPACRHPMIVVEFKQTELDFCPNCHGTWFDKGELELLLESAGVNVKDGIPFIRSVLEGPAAGTSERKRRCPICGKKMRKTRIGDQGGTLLDVCERGDGLWFDGGEIDQLVKIVEDKSHVKTEHFHVFNFMKEVFKAPAG